MLLETVEAHNFRLFDKFKIDLTEGLHVFYGANASGKTSILESIHFLCSCKSFLSVSPRKILKKNTADFFVKGSFLQDYDRTQTMSITWQEQKIALKIGYDNIYRTSEYAAIQPVLAIGPFSNRLIDDTPDVKRKFIDWGVFHVKHDFTTEARDFYQVLMQRNKILQKGVDRPSLKAWNSEFTKHAKKMDESRKGYIKLLRENLDYISRILLPYDELDIQYARGWSHDESLEEILEKNFEKDLERKFTYFGPHRADLTLKLNGLNVKETASRGQKKIIMFALYLAQMRLQNTFGKKNVLLLIDDLPSELDSKHIRLVLDFISSMNIQILISCISPDLLEIQSGDVSRMFHVKQGKPIKVV